MATFSCPKGIWLILIAIPIHFSHSFYSIFIATKQRAKQKHLNIWSGVAFNGGKSWNKITSHSNPSILNHDIRLKFEEIRGFKRKEIFSLKSIIHSLLDFQHEICNTFCQNFFLIYRGEIISPFNLGLAVFLK